MKASFLLASLFATLFTTQAAPLEARSSMSGSGTYYDVGLGSCGHKNSNSDMVAALSSDLMDGGKLCGKSITVKGKKGSVTLTVVDTCPSCDSGDVDMSSAAFKELGSLDEGRIPITWSY